MPEKEILVDNSSRKLIWERVRTIRESWNNPAQLERFLKEWDNEYGAQYADIVKEMIVEQTRKYWGAIAAQQGKNDLDALMRVLWLNWDEGEFTLTETADGIQIHCTKCPIADVFQSIGRPQDGLLFMCSEDPAIAEGFNPSIGFRRTKTLMGGDDCCDHHYSMKR